MEIAEKNKYYWIAVVSYRGKSDEEKTKELIVLSHRHVGCFEQIGISSNRATEISFLFLGKNNAIKFHKEALSKKLINKKYRLLIDRLKWVTDMNINSFEFINYAEY